MRLLSLAALALAEFAPSQDLIAIDWAGRVVGIDSHTLATQTIPTLPQLEGLVADGGSFWSIQQGTTGGSSQLVAIDLQSGATTPVRNTIDVLAVTGDGSGTLWCARGPTASPRANDTICRLDLATGAVTTLALWPFIFPQPTSLAFHRGELLGWDYVAGLLALDPATGALVRRAGAIPTGMVCTFLVSHVDGRLLGGFAEGPLCHLGEVDPATGQVADLGVLGAFVLRGCLPTGHHWWQPFGSGCNDVAGVPELVLQGYTFLGAGAQLTATSGNHATGTIGTMIFGASDTAYAGLPLPRSLDPLLGTVGCSLYASIDASLLGATPLFLPANLSFRFSIPAGGVGFTFFLQHAAIAPVPGLTSWSNAIAVHAD